MTKTITIMEDSVYGRGSLFQQLLSPFISRPDRQRQDFALEKGDNYTLHCFNMNKTHL